MWNKAFLVLVPRQKKKKKMIVKPPNVFGIGTHLENLQRRAAKVISGIYMRYRTKTMIEVITKE